MTWAPTTIGQLGEIVAGGSPAPLRIAGAGTKRTTGPVATGDADLLDMRGLAGIADYDPAECVATVLAGTPVAALRDTLAAHGQYLPWDPPCVDEGASVGGMVASGLSGPGRYRYGGVRDFVIGVRVADGRGRLVASGGQVVKNAAGFLTHHAMVGSAGRLGVIAEVSFKVFPRPEATRTLVARAATRAGALAAHEQLRLAGLDLDALDLDADVPAVYARLAGAADALPARAARAARAVEVPVEVLAGDEESRLWASVARSGWTLGGTVVKLPTTPSRLPALLDDLTTLGACRVSVGGAVVYLSTALGPDAIDSALSAKKRTGAIVHGPSFGRPVGVSREETFHDRVRASLDPDARFR